jgi:ABC-2 type transport system ATP-binding protein
MAIAGDPDLLVLDEPTVAMDVVTRRSFWAAMREWTGRGRTVVFATHYLEEADAFSDRVVVMAAGRIVADGTASAIKGLVAGRTVAATVPALAAAGHDAVLADLRALPGVVAAAVRGGRVTLSSTDSDRTLRALLAAHADACDVEVTGSGLEEAFVALTGGTDAIAPDAIARNAIAPIGATPAPAP